MNAVISVPTWPYNICTAEPKGGVHNFFSLINAHSGQVTNSIDAKPTNIYIYHFYSRPCIYFIQI